MKCKLSLLSLLVAGSLLTGCNDDDNEASPAQLKILHINYHHSHLSSDSADLMLAGAETRVEVGGFPRVVSKFNELAASTSDDVLKLHAGDAITGDKRVDTYLDYAQSFVDYVESETTDGRSITKLPLAEYSTSATCLPLSMKSAT